MKNYLMASDTEFCRNKSTEPQISCIEINAWSCHSYAEICIGINMRTTLDINDKLLAQAKSAAAREKSSLTRFIEEALAMRLRGRRPSKSGRGFAIPVYQGSGGLAPGVDPTSNRSLLEAADDFT
jgi:hypothetical protein